MTVQTFLKAAQAAGLAHNHGVGGEFILVGTGKQLEALERALVGDGGYVPGVMRCDRCKFELTRVSLNVNVGTVTAGNSEPEPCPNGCGALRPTTWKEHAQAAFDGVDALLERAEKAEKALAVRGAALGDATEQSLGLYAAQADAIRELLDKHAPWAAGNLQARIELVLNVLKVTANSAAGVDVPRADAKAVRAADPVPSLGSAVKLPLHQAAQWNNAVACAEREPHKLVAMEGRTVLAVHNALTSGVNVPQGQEKDRG